MGRLTQFDREEEAIIDAMNRGDISQEEGRRELRDLHRDYQAQAEEAAQDAYQRELERW